MKNLLLFTFFLLCKNSFSQLQVQEGGSLKYMLALHNESNGHPGIDSIDEAVGSGVIPQPFSIFTSVSEPVMSLSKSGDYKMFNAEGKLVKQISGAKRVGVSDLNSGAYFLVNQSGFAQKVIVK
ncbi:T9SS type A sorting domain-containing protein [Luteibaculum oceani]|uniref:T9SS type A sorting domain-containing protein n=1 Tax=Luteibaculum oceani TaxID=1294296 RepID=A0A5C6UQL3_9FLAO|nr:T9SS type A sorting domain-containing protein [Luteibaculum oceani]TXC75632.1 T9SS type A sorting domain-containing protein [Luteibaculum oceani]